MACQYRRGPALWRRAQYGIRVNASKYGGDTSMDHQSTDGHVLAVALDYEVERFRATLDLLSQDERIDGVGRPIMPTGSPPCLLRPTAHST